MTVIELVGAGVLDVKDDSPFSLNFQAQDVLDPSSRTSNFSKSISLVGSDNNNKILGFLFDINISDSTFNVNKLVECNVIQNGVNVFDTANFQLLSIDENPNGEIVYTGRVTSKTTDFFTKIKNKELQDLPMPVYGKALNKTNVIDSFGNIETDLFKFIALPNDLNSIVYNIRNFKPAIFLKTYFDAIHQAAGFVYNFDEWKDLKFDRLIIPNVNKIEANEELEEANNIEYLNTSSNTYPVSSGLTSNLDFGVATIDQNSQFNNATSTYTPNVSSKLVVEVEANIFFKMTWGGNGGRANGGPIKYELQAIVESDNYLSNKIEMYNFFSGEVVPVGNQIVFTNTVNFQIPITAIEGVPFSDIKFKVVQSGGGQWVDNVLNTPMNVPIEIEVNQIGIRSINDLSYNYGLPVYLKDFVPKKIKQSDFIKSICQMFNLVIITDAEKPNEIKYITRDKWYDEGKEVDWTNKADISKAIRKEWIQDKQAKQINLKYKADEDSVNKAYQDNFEQTFGAYEFEFENEFNTQESDEEIIFSPTPTVYNSNSNMYLPALTDGKQNIRILIDNGEKTDGYYHIEEEDGSAGALINNYAQALHIDDPKFPTFDINFGISSMYFHQLNRPTKNNLFNLRHFRKFSQLANGRLLTMYFVLNEIDVNKLELNDRIWVKDGFYNINKISNYNANGKQSTKVELITVDDGIRLDRNKIKYTIGVANPQPWRPNNPIINDGVGGIILENVAYKNNIVGGKNSLIFGSGNNVPKGFKGIIIGDNQNIDSQEGIIVNGVDIVKSIEKSLDGNIIYKARLYQTGANPPIITEYLNPSNLIITSTRVGAGSYSLLGFDGVLTGKIELEFNYNGFENDRVRISANTASSITIQSRFNGTLADDVIGLSFGSYPVLTVYKYD